MASGLYDLEPVHVSDGFASRGDGVANGVIGAIQQQGVNPARTPPTGRFSP